MRARDLLKSEWMKRIELVKKGRTPDRTNQRNLYYKIRYLADKGQLKMVSYENFKYQWIYKLEHLFSYMKEDLNIFSEPDATLYMRFGKELIEYRGGLYKCIAILATEKSGIAESLSEYLTKYGILVINTKGIQGRYPMQLAKRYNVPKFSISDYDVSGCFMMKRFENESNMPRITPLDIMKRNNIIWDDVVERDRSVKNNHWNSIDYKDQKKLRKEGDTYRVELDTIMSKIGPEHFAKTILEILDEKIKIKNMRDVMVIKNLPEEVEEKLEAIKRALIEKYRDMREDALEFYEDMEAPFRDLNLNELEDDAETTFDDEYNDGEDKVKEIKIIFEDDKK